MSSVLSLRDAAARLPTTEDIALGWFRDQGLVRELAGSLVVVWDDVISTLRHGRVQPPRRTPTDAEVVSEDRAARALPWRRSDAVSWLRREGLSRAVDGRRVVVWRSVLASLEKRPHLPAAPRSAKRREEKLLASPGRLLGD